MDPKESVFEEVRHLPEVGVATLKLFMAYKGTAFYCDDEAILNAMMNAKRGRRYHDGPCGKCRYHNHPD